MIFSHLGGGDVLTLPAVGVADAVDEIEEALRILAHEVPGSIPAVAGDEHVTQDLLLRRCAVSVALEARRFLIANDLADGFSYLIYRATLASTVASARR